MSSTSRGSSMPNKLRERVLISYSRTAALIVHVSGQRFHSLHRQVAGIERPSSLSVLQSSQLHCPLRERIDECLDVSSSHVQSVFFQRLQQAVVCSSDL